MATAPVSRPEPALQPTFLVVWAGQSISALGNVLLNVALMWWVVKATGSGTAMAVVGIIGAVPRVVLGPLAGVFADRQDRRVLLLLADSLNGLLTLTVAIVAFKSAFSLPFIIIAMAVQNAIFSLHGPAYQASIPNLVGLDQLVRVNSLVQTVNGAIGVVGPALGGVIVAVAGIGSAILVDAVSFFLAAASLLVIRFPRTEGPTAKSRPSPWRDAATGFRFLFAHRLLGPMLGFFAVINLTLAPLSVALPLLVTKVLEGGPELFGLIGSFESAGFLVASLVLSAVPRLLKRTGLGLVVGIIGIGAGIALMGLSVIPVLTLLAAALTGVAIVVASVTSQTIFQAEVPDEVRGRVFAARIALGQGLYPLGMAVAGGLADWLGAASLMTLSGRFCAVAGFLGFAVPGLRAYQSGDATAPAAPGPRGPR
ncbi:MAG: MFS transporter [Bacillota bacterium]